ncbi:EVE domain-containing protein [Bacillus subtilis]|nr:EVE domain-containing protein [Bacillus subtilis]MDM5303958.1 EVE domain-containing protein [Bacillus subtilis]MDM5326011.1 EVE domain-containing protein [Bacillus subtilis]
MPVQHKRYWVGVASRDHVIKAIQGGFAQLCHGKEAPLKKMNKGDWIIYYSPKVNIKDSTPYQKFTALGKVVDRHIFFNLIWQMIFSLFEDIYISFIAQPINPIPFFHKRREALGLLISVWAF